MRTASRVFWLLVFVAVVFGPLLAVLWRALAEVLAGEVPATPLTGVRQLMLLARSVGLAGAVALAGMTVGTLAALRLWQWRSGAGTWLRWAVLVFAPIPPYIHALVWNETTWAAGSVLAPLGLGPVSLRGWTASWFVQTVALLPLAVGLALVGLEMVRPRLTEAARTHGPDLRVLGRVILPLAAPYLVAGGALLFLLTLMDYSVPSLLSVNVYATEVFAEYSASSDVGSALAIALPLIVVALLAVVAAQSALRNAASSHSREGPPGGGPMRWPTWLRAATLCALGVVAGQALVMLVALVAATGSASELAAAVSAAGREIGYTLATALGTALAAVPLALVAARGMVRPTGGGRLWRLLVSLPFAVPAPLVGIGLIAICALPLSPRGGGGLALPALAALSRFVPVAAIAVLAQLRRIDPALLDAAAVFGRRPRDLIVQVYLPLLGPGLLAAAAISFALTVGELGATLMVAPPGWPTVTMRIYSYLHYGGSSEVAGLCLAMAAMAITAGLLAALALSRWSTAMPATRVQANLHGSMTG